MAADMLSTNFGIDQENLAGIVEEARDFAVCKGLGMRPKNLPPGGIIPVPFCLVPSHIPRTWFELAASLQEHMNYVLHRVSRSRDFLKNCLASTIKVDEFTANIFKIYEAVERERDKNQLSLGLIRSDYLLDTDSSGIITGMKQVENNTIATSFPSLAPIIQELHLYVLDRLGLKDFHESLPQNKSGHEFTKAILSAWDAYDNPSAVILFVVEKVTTNICDQRILEYTIYEFENNVQVLRCSFEELRTCTELKGQKLMVKGNEVAVVYYRDGYMPEHYEPEDWETRLLMERSSAIKCPSAGLHLAGTKRVQQHLAQPGVLEMFLPEHIAEKLRQVFACQFSLDMNADGDRSVSLAIKDPEKYVMKPEREGGGNNVFGGDVKKVLSEIGSSTDRQAYILMERIYPPPVSNCIVRSGTDATPSFIMCEIGIYGTILGDDENVYLNAEAGHIIRSKKMDSDEGGIVAGFGALDSPFLV